MVTKQCKHTYLKMVKVVILGIFYHQEKKKPFLKAPSPGADIMFKSPHQEIYALILFFIHRKDAICVGGTKFVDL